MEVLSSDLIYQAVKLLGAQRDASEEQEEEQLRALVRDELTVRRLADVIPEAFGLVLASHLPGAENMTLPDTFCAQDDDEWVEFSMRREPIFVVALDIAQHTFHNGPRALMQNLADRSSLLSTINKALDAGSSLDGTTLGPPSFFGLPAALYQPAASSDTP